MVRRLLLLFALFLLPGIAWCDEYKFGVMPWQVGQSIDDIRVLYKPMLEWLGKRTGHTFLIVGARDYDQMIDYLAEGRVHLCSISPSPYILAKRKNPGVVMLVTELSLNKETGDRTDSYRGYILTLKNRGDINELKDLKGKYFAFVDAESTSGFKYPAALMAKQGIDYKTYFAKYIFLGGHPLVTDAIAAGSVDAGATWDYNWNKAIAKHGDIFKQIFATQPIPNLGIAAHPSIPGALQQKIQDALLSIDPKLLNGLPAAGYVKRPESFYDIVRELTD